MYERGGDMRKEMLLMEIRRGKQKRKGVGKGGGEGCNKVKEELN